MLRESAGVDTCLSSRGEGFDFPTKRYVGSELKTARRIPNPNVEGAIPYRPATGSKR
jgi:hypothetical protein